MGVECVGVSENGCDKFLSLSFVIQTSHFENNEICALETWLPPTRRCSKDTAHVLCPRFCPQSTFNCYLQNKGIAKMNIIYCPSVVGV